MRRPSELRTSRLRSLALALLFVGATATTAYAIDIFLEVDGVPGPSADAGFLNEFTPHSLSFEVARDSSGVRFEELVVTLDSEFHSAELLTAHLEGRTIPTMTLRMRRSGGLASPTVVFYVIELTDVQVTSLRELDEESESLVEVGLRFGAIDLTYTRLARDGTPAGSVTGGYDLVTGIAR